MLCGNKTMAERIPVECPHCSQTLKLKNPKLVGTKVKCPKRKKPFVVQVDTFVTRNAQSNEPLKQLRGRLALMGDGERPARR